MLRYKAMRRWRRDRRPESQYRYDYDYRPTHAFSISRHCVASMNQFSRYPLLVSVFTLQGDQKRSDDPIKALGTKSYISLALTFIGAGGGGFVVLVALDRLLGG
jgi:hypothetical protein